MQKTPVATWQRWLRVSTDQFFTVSAQLELTKKYHQNHVQELRTTWTSGTGRDCRDFELSSNRAQRVRYTQHPMACRYFSHWPRQHRLSHPPPGFVLSAMAGGMAVRTSRMTIPKEYTWKRIQQDFQWLQASPTRFKWRCQNPNMSSYDSDIFCFQKTGLGLGWLPMHMASSKVATPKLDGLWMANHKRSYQIYQIYQFPYLGAAMLHRASLNSVTCPVRA
jgi:hypothetical protein